METRKRRGFPQDLGKASMRNSRLYHTFHKRRRRRPQPNAALTGTGFGTAVFFHEKLPTTNREDRAKEGWLRPLRKSGEASLAGADGEAVKKLESSAIPLLASLQGGVAERFRKYREASAYREAGVVFR